MDIRNIIAEPFKVEKFVNNVFISQETTNYNIWPFNIIAPINKKQLIGVGSSEITNFLYNSYDSDGNLLEIQKPKGVKTSFKWGYDGKYPVMKVVNAKGEKQISVNTSISSYIDITPTKKSGSITFTATRSGTLTIYPNSGGDPGQTYSLRYQLSNGVGGTICVYRGGNSPSCNSTSPNVNIDIQAGTYTMTATMITSTNPDTYAYFSFDYPGLNTVSSGDKEFFYEGFEEMTNNPQVIPYAGVGCYFGDYSIPANLNLSTERKYKVNYRYFDGTIWNMKTIDYSNNLILSDGIAIDEVRIFPEDARMTTYTYNPLVGMTSQTDPKGLTLFYEYDDFSRLKYLIDQNGNIIKSNTYNYKQ